MKGKNNGYARVTGIRPRSNQVEITTIIEDDRVHQNIKNMWHLVAIAAFPKDVLPAPKDYCSVFIFGTETKFCVGLLS